MNRLLGRVLIALMVCMILLVVVLIVAPRAGWFQGQGPRVPKSTDSGAKNRGKPTNSGGAQAGDFPIPGLPEYLKNRLYPRFPAFVDVPVKHANEIVDEVRDDELVLGVVIEGQARAWPINQLHTPQREVFNEVLGGTPIAATW
jgi:hypothetical protein